MREVGALEPKPGLPPTASHLSELLLALRKRAGEGGRACRLQRSAAGASGWPSARRFRASMLPSRSAAATRRRTCSACSTTRSRACCAASRMSAASTGHLWPALAAGCWSPRRTCRSASRCSSRGIVFIDLAIAQIAGLGVILADWLGFEPQGGRCRLRRSPPRSPARCCCTWTEKHWPEVQEAIIGVTFILAASGALLLLAANPHGGEHLKELLVGPDPVGQLLRSCRRRARLRRRCSRLWFGWASAEPHWLLSAIRVRGNGFGAARRSLPRVHDADRARARDARASPRAARRRLSPQHHRVRCRTHALRTR